MTVKENSQNFELRLKNALDFYNFLKMDLIKIPQVAFPENLDYNSEACTLIYSEKKNGCFDLNPDGSFSAVCRIKIFIEQKNESF